MARKNANTSSTLQTFGLTTATPLVRLVGPSGTVLREIAQPLYVLNGQLVVQARKALWPVTGADGNEVAIAARVTPIAELPAGTKRANVTHEVAALGAKRVTLAMLGVAQKPKASGTKAPKAAKQPAAKPASIASAVSAILANTKLTADERIAAINALASA